MGQATRAALLVIGVGLTACVSQPPSTPGTTSTTKPTVSTDALRTETPFTGPGHDWRNAIQFPGINNPLAFSQKQQEWLWLHYRDWKKLSQYLRERDGATFDEVTLQSKSGEKRVIYFRMPKLAKP